MRHVIWKLYKAAVAAEKAIAHHIKTDPTRGGLCLIFDNDAIDAIWEAYDEMRKAGYELNRSSITFKGSPGKVHEGVCECETCDGKCKEGG